MPITPFELDDDARRDELRQLRLLEFASLLEATTLVLLVLVAVPLKHLAGWPAGVRIGGPIHGFAFVLYIWICIQAMAGGDWTVRERIRVIGAAFVPFAGFANLRFLAHKIAALKQTNSELG